MAWERGRLGRRSAGEPNGGSFAPYDVAFTHFMPVLKKRLGKHAAQQVFVENPARALARSASP